MTRWINGVKPSDVMTGPEKWTTGEFARTKSGHAIEPECGKAVCFCLLGVVKLCAANSFAERKRLEIMLDTCDLDKWNDDPTRTFDEIITVLLKLEAMK